MSDKVERKGLGASRQTRESIASIANEIILESISDGVFTVDHEWRIISFNRAAEEITGIPRAEARTLLLGGLPLEYLRGELRPEEDYEGRKILCEFFYLYHQQG